MNSDSDDLVTNTVQKHQR